MIKQLPKIAALVILLALIGAACYYFFLFSPQLTWDQSPETLVVYTGIDVRDIDYNYIPDFRLWGDGRVVWVRHLPDGKRTIFEGRLPEKEILNSLEKLKDAGFFKPRFPFDRADHPTCHYQGFEDGYFYVDLLHNRYAEKVWTKDRKICDALNALVTGTEIAGQAYVPAEGKLYFVPIEKAGLPLDTPAVYQWSDADFPFRPEIILSADKNGKVIQGQDLKLAWDIVNRSSQPVVVSNGKKFWIAVTVPGISDIY